MIQHRKMSPQVCRYPATGEEQRNSSRRNEEAEPKQKQCSVFDVSGGKSKVWYCKENTAQEPEMLGS